MIPLDRRDELPSLASAFLGVVVAVREAIAGQIARKRKDKAFRERLRAVTERDREILERLARRGLAEYLDLADAAGWEQARRT